MEFTPRLRRLVAGLVLIPTLACPVPAAMTVGEMQCEHVVNPLGIDRLSPRLGWTLLSDHRGARQSAYQIQVAESPADLAGGSKLLWDSGRVASDQSVDVEYAGPTLRPGQACHWRVRVWDEQGEASPWSAPALWQVALISPSDWHAEWIGPPDELPPAWEDLDFSASFTIKTGSVGFLFRARDSANYCWWRIVIENSELVLRPYLRLKGQMIELPPSHLGRFIASAAAHDPHQIRIELRGNVVRTYIDHLPVNTRTEQSLGRGTVGFHNTPGDSALVGNVTVTAPGRKEPLLANFPADPGTFPGARIENDQLVLEGKTLLHRPPLPMDCPRLRHRIMVAKPVRRATASVCGLGFYELYLNGSKVSDHVLSPPNSQYQERLLFDTLDVTAALKVGANSVGLWLAPGYADDYSPWGWRWNEPKRAILQLDLTYEDGTTETFGTNGNWQAGGSPLLSASLYDGEVHDGRLETPGWADAAAVPAGWKPVRRLDPPSGRLVPNPLPALRVTQTLRPVAVTEPSPGVFVFDFGQNFAGWVRLRARGPAGTRVTLRHSELVDAQGAIDPWTNRRAKATDVTILRGEGEEVHEPRFTYHGFRYVEVTGYPGRPTPEDITGCVVHVDAPAVGSLTTSDELLNRIHANCVWSMRSNLMGIPTDCCMRDERTPCQMDSLAYEEAALCNFDLSRYYTKWLGDIRGGRGNPDWHGDQVFLPWRLYWHYGDRRVLAENFDTMRDFVADLAARRPDHVWTEGYGDWCAPNQGTWETYFNDVPDVNTSLYVGAARIVAEAATVLGRPADATRFAALAEQIASAYHGRRFNAVTGTYGDGSQTTAVLPLAFGLVPAAEKGRVLDALVARISGPDRGHVDTGIFGTRYLLDVLADGGHADLGLSMLRQPGYPGFADQIAQGATTLWEQWTAKGGMNSHNHAMFAGIDSSLYSRLAGITALRPGFAEISIRPVVPSTLDFVEASLHTVRGPVAVRWWKEGPTLRLKVSVPANTRALIAVPTSDAGAVTEGGRPAAAAPGLTPLGARGGAAEFAVGSGDYLFAAPLR